MSDTYKLVDLNNKFDPHLSFDLFPLQKEGSSLISTFGDEYRYTDIAHFRQNVPFLSNQMKNNKYLAIMIGDKKYLAVNSKPKSFGAYISEYLPRLSMVPADLLEFGKRKSKKSKRKSAKKSKRKSAKKSKRNSSKKSKKTSGK